MQIASVPLSLYLHIPFCATKCSYCAFNTYVQMNDLVPAFIDALCEEIALVGKASGRESAHTVFFGGGTPSLLLPDQIERLLAAIDKAFVLAPDAEITMETNPNDLTLAWLKMVRAVGVNRLSIGMQSADAEDLQLFERRHDVQSVIDAVRDARRAGFDNLSLDLIYGAPGQSLERWQHTLQAALALDPDHLSLYALSLEAGTPMRAAVETGHLAAPDDDLAADMYDLASEMLQAHGFGQYEISNWARPGCQSRHNLQYWLNAPYLGFGPGAHGFAGGVRYSVLLSPQRYIRALADETIEKHDYPLSPAVAEWTQVGRDQEISETLIMGMRLIGRGIDRREFRARFGQDLLEIHGATIQHYADQGLLDVSAERVMLTGRGRLLSNVVLREFV